MGIITQKKEVFEKIGVRFGMSIRMMVFLLLAKLKAPYCISETILNIEIVIGLVMFIYAIISTRYLRRFPLANKLRKRALFKDGINRLEILCCEICFNLAMIGIHGLSFIGIVIFYIVAVSFCSQKAIEIMDTSKID